MICIFFIQLYAAASSVDEHAAQANGVRCPLYVALEPLKGNALKRVGQYVEEMVWGDARAVHAAVYIHWPDGIYRYEFDCRGQALVTPTQTIPTEPGEKTNAIYIAKIGYESRSTVDNFIQAYVRKYSARNNNCRTFVDEFLCCFVHQERWYMDDKPWLSNSPLEWIHRMRRERAPIPEENLRPLPTMLLDVRAPFVLVWSQDGFHHAILQDQQQAIQRYNNIDFQWSRAMVSTANGNVVGKHCIQGWGERCEQEARRIMAGLNTSTAQQTQSAERSSVGSGLVIPAIAKGHEEIYLRFITGKLIYRPSGGCDRNQKVMSIFNMVNRETLEGSFDLSQCGDTGQYLSIATGYKKGKLSENAGKLEIWFAPRFLIEKELATTALNFEGIMGAWQATAPVGIFWTWGCDQVAANNFDYLINESIEQLSNNDLQRKWGGMPAAGGLHLRWEGDVPSYLWGMRPGNAAVARRVSHEFQILFVS